MRSPLILMGERRVHDDTRPPSGTCNFEAVGVQVVVILHAPRNVVPFGSVRDA